MYTSKRETASHVCTINVLLVNLVNHRMLHFLDVHSCEIALECVILRRSAKLSFTGVITLKLSLSGTIRVQTVVCGTYAVAYSFIFREL